MQKSHFDELESPRKGDKAMEKEEMIKKSMRNEADSLTKAERQQLVDAINLSHQAYPQDLDKQLALIHFHAEAVLGKRVQAFITKSSSVEGHCLSSSFGKHLDIELFGCFYIIWKVRLIEDAEDNARIR